MSEYLKRDLPRWSELREAVTQARDYTDWLTVLAHFLSVPRYEQKVVVTSAATGKKGRVWLVDEESSLKKIPIAYVTEELKFRSIVPNSAKSVLAAQLREIERSGAQVMTPRSSSSGSGITLVFSIEEVRRSGRQTRAISYRKAFVVQIAHRA